MSQFRVPVFDIDLFINPFVLLLLLFLLAWEELIVYSCRVLRLDVR